jgi:signal transduction histidine kinase/ActR/RegA family two-component response regulator
MLKNLAIRRKLVFIVMCASALTLLLASVGLMSFDLASFREAMARDLSIKAKIIGANAARALSFEDSAGASDILQALHEDPQIATAAVYDRGGNRFVSYARKGWTEKVPEKAPLSVSGESPGRMWVDEPLKSHGEVLGHVFVSADTSAWYQRVKAYTKLAGMIFLGCALLSFFVAAAMQSLITRPILVLGRAMARVRNEKRYSLRATRAGSDEIGKLIDGFNEMLSEIEARDAELLQARDVLEERVKDRTKELENQVEDTRRAERRLAVANRDLKVAVEEARELAQAAQAANKAKSEFLANMSHEIRTPMNGVIGMTELLLDTELGEHQRDYAGTIRSSAESLLSLINDILDFSKIEAGKMSLEVVDLDLWSITREVVEQFSHRAKKKGLTLVTTSTEDMPLMLGDPTRVRQILTNLIANAVKFTEHGGVEVDLDLVGAKAGIAQTRIYVRDTGIGISSDRLESIFASFTQADGSTTRRYGGTGLGLTICRQLVELMGGHISVTSRVGEGSSFVIDLPLKCSDRKVQEETAVRTQFGPSEQRMTLLTGIRVLLAEDNSINQRIAVQVLSKAGCEVDAVETGQEALDALKAAQYDVVLMDCQMPIMDGLMATRAIRDSGEPWSTIPIIAVTANAMSGDREICLQAGMDDYLAKPIKPNQLLETIVRWAAPGKARDAA